MGYYINPENISKEQWLKLYAIESTEEFCTWYLNKRSDMLPDILPVILGDMGTYTAAVIVYSSFMFSRYTSVVDTRPKKYYIAPITLLLEVCPEFASYWKHKQR